jgi:argininosuccinate synthase
VSINEVPMPPVELVESLALIAGRHGVGRLESSRNGRTVVYDAPAAMVLHTAHAALTGRTGVVHLSVLNGGCTVLNNAEAGRLA